ncbi:unnamed protein product, partial [Schistosoma curassoni]|uniref:Homeobox protein 2-like n=1 Tax=Schistosoma curassoni TaxID=6186 RepID=A0A183KXF7_9TREM
MYVSMEKLLTQNNSDPLARHYQQQLTVGENKPDPKGRRNQEEALEVDKTHIEESTQLHHKVSHHMESSRPREEMKTKEHIMPKNGNRHEKNEQLLERARKVGPGQNSSKSPHHSLQSSVNRQSYMNENEFKEKTVKKSNLNEEFQLSNELNTTINDLDDATDDDGGKVLNNIHCLSSVTPLNLSIDNKFINRNNDNCTFDLIKPTVNLSFPFQYSSYYDNCNPITNMNMHKSESHINDNSINTGITVTTTNCIYNNDNNNNHYHIKENDVMNNRKTQQYSTR